MGPEVAPSTELDQRRAGEVGLDHDAGGKERCEAGVQPTSEAIGHQVSPRDHGGRRVT